MIATSCAPSLRENSSGGKPKLGRISKMGNRNLRKLLVVRAHAVLFHRKSHTDPLRMWVKKLIDPRTRLRALVATPGFEAEYLGALRGEAPSKRKGLAAGTLGWLSERYCDSSAWSGLSESTRRQRESIMKHVLKAAANAPSRRSRNKWLSLDVSGVRRRLSRFRLANQRIGFLRLAACADSQGV